MLNWLRRTVRADRGSATVYTAVFTIAVIFLLALILDGGLALNAKQRAWDIAGQAARAAADHINVGALRKTGAVVIGAGACTVARNLAETYSQGMNHGIDRVTGLSNWQCIAPEGAHVASVTVTLTTHSLVPGLPSRFTASVTQTATVECGINTGGKC